MDFRQRVPAGPYLDSFQFIFLPQDHVRTTSHQTTRMRDLAPSGTIYYIHDPCHPIGWYVEGDGGRPSLAVQGGSADSVYPVPPHFILQHTMKKEQTALDGAQTRIFGVWGVVIRWLQFKHELKTIRVAPAGRLQRKTVVCLDIRKVKTQ